MFIFEKLRYNDHQNVLSRIEDSYNQIRKLLFQLTLDFTNKVSGSLANEDFLKHRDSIQLRLSSILYHYDILSSLNISGQEFVSTMNISPSVTRQIALKQDFLFDSIVFNILSLFDYTGCLIKYIIERNKQKQKTQWPKVVNSAKWQLDFKQSSLALAIVNMDRMWVNPLGNYRAELIHYTDDDVNDGLTYNVIQSKYSIHISAPIALKKYFKELKKEGNLNINQVALWIIENSENALLELLKELINYLDVIRVFPPEREVIIMKDRKTSSDNI